MVTPTTAVAVRGADAFRVEAGGAESNVAAHVAALGHHARWFSRLGDDPLGHRILDALAERGVDTSSVIIDRTGPTGLYVKDPGRGVHYYRRGSAASALAPADVDRVDFDGVDLLHVSGITAAISDSAALFLARLLERARDADIPRSFDVNHRAPLWSIETAAPVLLELARDADVVFVGRDEAEALWGTSTAGAVRDLLHDVPELIVKDGDVGATAYTDAGVVFEPALRVEVLEAVGAGDAFAGGYLAGRLSGHPVAQRLRSGHERAAQVLATTSDIPDEPPPAADRRRPTRQ